MKPEPIQRENGCDTANTDMLQHAPLKIEFDDADGATPVYLKTFGKTVALIADKPHHLIFP